MGVYHAEYHKVLDAAVASLKAVAASVPQAAEAAEALHAATAEIFQEWSDLEAERKEFGHESQRLAADRDVVAIAKNCHEVDRIKAIVDDSVRPLRKAIAKLHRLVFDETLLAFETISEQLNGVWAAVEQPPRPANGTRGSVRSPRTGPSAPRPTRASGKTNPSRAATGKPSRSAWSGASPKTPRKATARPQRTARKSPRTG